MTTVTRANLARDLKRAAGLEEIEAVVLGRIGGRAWVYPDAPDTEPVGQVLSWGIAHVFLDRDFDPGFGSPDCHAFYAWTATRVFFVSEYDGSTGITSVPRHPTPCIPEYPS